MNLKSKSWCLLFLSVLLLFPLASASQLSENITSIERYSTVDGLADNDVKMVLTDSKGVLWIGTESGLNSYLNTNFELYNEATIGGQLAGHAVSTLFLDSRSWLWVGDRFLGLSCYNPSSNTWKKFYNQSGPNAQFEGKEIIDLVEDGRGDIWLAAFPDILIHYSVSENSFTHHKLNIEKAYHGIQSLHRLNDYQLLVNTGSEGMLRFDIRNGKFEKDLLFYRSFGIKQLAINDKIQTDSRGNIVLLKDGQILIRINEEPKAKPIGSYEGFERPTCNYTVDGEFIVGIFPNVFRFDSNYRLLSTQRMLPRYNDRILNCVFRSICQDRQGIIWIGTNQGLLKIDPAKQVFKSFMNIAGQAALEKGEEDIRCLLSDREGNIWAGPRRGRNIHCIKPYKNLRRLIEYSITDGSNKEHTINSMIQLFDGRILAVGYSGFFIKDTGNAFIPFLQNSIECPEMANAWSLLQLRDSNLLIGTKDLGLHYINLRSEKIAAVRLLNSDGSDFQESFATWNIFEDARGTMWLASSKGLYQAIPQSPTCYRLMPFLNLKDCSVWAVMQAKNGILWIGTVEFGLIGLDASGRHIQSIGLLDGLPSMTIRGIVEDMDGQLWVSTSAAISRIRFENGTYSIRNFDVLDGLPVEGFSSKSACMGPTNNLFFASHQGLVYFDPKIVGAKKKPAYLLLRSHSESDSSYKIQDLEGNTFLLSPGNSSFSFEPALSDYSNPGKNRFFYLLEGVDDDWNQSNGEHPSIKYSRILPGAYNLHIRAENPDGTAALNEWHIPIQVESHFWLRPWFKVGILGVLLLLVVYVGFLALNRMRLRRQLLRSEIASLRLQMNPHFIFNSLNSIQDLIYHDEKLLASSYLTRIARLIRSILENSSKSSISLEDEIVFLRLYLELESLRFPTRFTYAIEVDATIECDEYTIPPMLLQPLIENALKHGMGGEERKLELKIRFEQHGDSLHCRIQDNGVGFPYSEINRVSGHQSMGLRVVRDRLAYLNKLEGNKYFIEVNSSNGKTTQSGTEINIRL